MEDVIPAPLIYRHLASQPALTVQPSPLVRIPAVQTRPVHKLRTPPPSQSSKAPQTVPLAEQLLFGQPDQPGQLLPTMSYFCRNLGRVSKDMTHVLRALSAGRAREPCTLPTTTPITVKTQPSCPSAVLARPPPAPTKARLPYTLWSSVLYAESDLESDG